MKSDIVTIIAYYNGSKFIERALTSLKRQTIKSDEIIIVDDGSKYVEFNFLKNLTSKYEFKIFRKENGGQGSARNLGVLNSDAKYITFLDQDDFYLENHNEILLNSIPLNDPRFGWVYGDLWHADEDGKILNMSILGETKCRHPKMNIKEMIGDDMFILPSASLISRKAFLDVGGFDEQFTGYEDDDLFIRLFRNGWTNYFTKTPVSVWCINEGSTSYSAKMATSRVKYFIKLLKSFPDSDFTGVYYSKNIIIPRFVDMVIDQGIKYCKRPKEDAKVYLRSMVDFKKITDKFDFIQLPQKKLIEDIINILEYYTQINTNKILEDSEVEEKINLTYKEHIILGRPVKFLDIKKIKEQNEEQQNDLLK